MRRPATRTGLSTSLKRLTQGDNLQHDDRDAAQIFKLIVPVTSVDRAPAFNVDLNHPIDYLSVQAPTYKPRQIFHNSNKNVTSTNPVIAGAGHEALATTKSLVVPNLRMFQGAKRGHPTSCMKKSWKSC